MAAPTPPDLTSLVAEALAKAGYSNPSAALTSRASTKWIEELKADVWTRANRQKWLQARACQVLTKGLGVYSNPSDFASDLSMQFATGSRYGQLQAATTTELTLAAAETAGELDVIGKEIAITSGSLSGTIAYITAYNPSTKVATVPTLSGTPSASDSYVILDFYQEIEERPIWEMRNLSSPSTLGIPEKFYPQGSSTQGQYRLWPIPYRTDSQPMVIVQDYYADLTELDLASTLMATLYQKWRNLWLHGLKWKALEDADDDRAVTARVEYANEVQKLVRESYGNELQNQSRVMDYN